MGDPAVCPFCPMHCDDVRFGPDGQVSVDCQIARSGFAAAVGPAVHRIGARKVTAEEAIENARACLTSLAKPSVSCSGATLGLARPLAGLSAGDRIDLSLETTPALAALGTAASREGFIAATLGDVKKHADLIWVIGNVADQTPRLAEHFPPDADVRSLAPFSIDDVAALAMRPDDETFGAARYVAIVLAHDAFDADESLVVAQWWSKLIVRANRHRRVVQLVMDPSQTIRSVAGWTSNQSLAASERPTDVRFGNSVGGHARLQIGGIDPGPELADAFVATTVPGIHRRDAVIRGDGAVTLGLEKQIEPTPDRIDAVALLNPST